MDLYVLRASLATKGRALILYEEIYTSDTREFLCQNILSQY
jgi:hypothetical protein